jgi:hypothetical protein
MKARYELDMRGGMAAVVDTFSPLDRQGLDSYDGFTVATESWPLGELTKEGQEDRDKKVQSLLDACHKANHENTVTREEFDSAVSELRDASDKLKRFCKGNGHFDNHAVKSLLR